MTSGDSQRRPHTKGLLRVAPGIVAPAVLLVVEGGKVTAMAWQPTNE